MEKIALCTAEDIKGITAVTASDYTFDHPIIKNAILMASAIIIRFLGRPVIEGEVTDTFTIPRDYKGNFYLFPTAGPIKDGTISVQVDGVDALDAVTKIGTRYVYSTRQTLENSIITMTYTGGWPVREQTEWENVQVVDVPGDIVQACAMQASYMANHYLKNNVGDKATGAKAGAMLLIPEAAVLLHDYRRQRYMGI